MLRISNLTCGYGSLPVVHGVDLVLEEGESMALLGANGAGKSTLMKAVAGWLPSLSGVISWHGTDLTQTDARDRVLEGLVLVPQDANVFADLSVETNLRISQDIAVAGATSLREAYQQFPVLSERRKQLAGSLSGGERQLLALVSALMLRPRMLLLDEPTTGLSPVLVDQICAVIRSILEQGVGVVWVVEQEPETALMIVDRAEIMAGGRFVKSLRGDDLQNADISQLILGGRAEDGLADA